MIRSFGPADSLAERLKNLVMAWDVAGRPGEQQLHIRAYPRGQGYSVSASEAVLAKTWTNFVCGWS